ncbi:CHAD domain-containing protein, partial [Undibacterium sp.]|uniref:CYTH and CHAD domain-containing protein n=1 Tax=Undibacterium sp. TaxID=1914977 RepID=UPI002BB57E1E
TGDEVEFALDQGIVQSNGRQETISEIELELKSGQPERLFELALQLQKKIPVRIANISKAQRGYALYRPLPSPPAAVKAVKLKLPARLSTEQAFRAIIANCLTQMQGNEAGVAVSDDPECLHQMRVGLRRLRSALSLYKDLIAAPIQTQQDIDWLSAQLGAARDWDVLAHSTLPAVAGVAEADLQIAPLRSAALMQAGSKHEAASAAVQSPRYARLLLGLSARAHGVAWSGLGQQTDLQALDKPVGDFANEMVARARNRLRKRGKHVYPANVPTQAQALHRLRIAAKKLRYTTEFFHSLYASRRVQPYVAALTNLQDALGRLNDAAIATGLLKQLLHAQAGLDSAASFVRGYLASCTEHEAAGLEELWQEFSAMKALGKA